MPAKKSTSPEAAQRKVWSNELKTTEANRRKVAKDYDKERDRLWKAFMAARKKLDAFDLKMETGKPRALAKFDDRIAVLKGRLGL
jgi:hypothetical protein